MPRAVRVFERVRPKVRRRLLGWPVLVWIVALPMAGFALTELHSVIDRSIRPIRDRVLFQTFFAVETVGGEFVPANPAWSSPTIWQLRTSGEAVAVHGLSIRLRRTAAVPIVLGLRDPIERWSLLTAGSFTEIDGQVSEASQEVVDRMFLLQEAEQGAVSLVPDAAELFEKGRGEYRQLQAKVLAADGLLLGAMACGVLFLIAAFRLVIARGGEIRLRRASRGRCPHCSYDLAGSVPGRCPECGCLPRADELAVLAGCVSMQSP